MVAAKAAAMPKFNVGKRKGATLRDVAANKWVRAMALHLKQSGKLFVPNCAELMKQSTGNERAPQNVDWYFFRCAAVLRRVYVRPGTGYGGLAKAFAILKNNGSRPEKTVKASRGLLHWACRSLEGLKLLGKGKESGRVLTREGKRKCDAIAFNVKSGRKAVGAAPTGKKTTKK